MWHGTGAFPCGSHLAGPPCVSNAHFIYAEWGTPPTLKLSPKQRQRQAREKKWVWISSSLTLKWPRIHYLVSLCLTTPYLQHKGNLESHLKGPFWMTAVMTAVRAWPAVTTHPQDSWILRLSKVTLQAAELSLRGTAVATGCTLYPVYYSRLLEHTH